MATKKRRSGPREDLDAGAIRKQVLDNPLFDTAEISTEKARSAALVMAGIAIEKGATSEANDNLHEPCGLDEVMDALFGTIPTSAPRPHEGPVERIVGLENIPGLRRDL